MLFKRGQELVKAQRKFSPGDFMSQSAQLVLEIDFYFMCKFRAPEKKYIVFFVACLFVFLVLCFVNSIFIVLFIFSMVIKICTILELCVWFLFSVEFRIIMWKLIYFRHFNMSSDYLTFYIQVYSSVSFTFAPTGRFSNVSLKHQHFKRDLRAADMIPDSDIAVVSVK